MDYHGATAQNNPSTDTAKEVIHILQNHYCERLGRAVVMNVPWYLNAFFSVIKPLLDPRTSEKIKFNPHMQDLVAREQLDSEFGGELAYTYDARVYLPSICHFCGIKQDGTREAWIPKDYPEHELAKPDGIQKRMTGSHQDRNAEVENSNQGAGQPNGHASTAVGVMYASDDQTRASLMAQNPPSADKPPFTDSQQLVPSSEARTNTPNGNSADAAALTSKNETATSETAPHYPPDEHRTASGAYAENLGSNTSQQKPAASLTRKKRGGPKLFSSKRGLDKTGQPTLHKHKHLAKALCMHKGAIDPSSASAFASTSTASPEVQAEDGELSSEAPAPDDTLFSEPSKDKFRIAPDANESKASDAPISTNTVQDPEAAEGETAEYFTDGRHIAVPVNHHEDHAEVVTKPQDLMHRLQTDTSEQLTMAFQVMKPPTGMEETAEE